MVLLTYFLKYINGNIVLGVDRRSLRCSQCAGDRYEAFLMDVRARIK